MVSRSGNSSELTHAHKAYPPLVLVPFEHCVLRELMRTSLLIRDGLRTENAANLHRQTATH